MAEELGAEVLGSAPESEEALGSASGSEVEDWSEVPGASAPCIFVAYREQAVSELPTGGSYTGLARGAAYASEGTKREGRENGARVTKEPSPPSTGDPTMRGENE